MLTLQRQLEQGPFGEFDMDPDITPGIQPDTDNDDSGFGLAVSALDQLVNSPPPSQPPSNQVKRVRFDADDAACQAGATLTGLEPVAHGPRANFAAPEETDINGGPAQQQKKKRGRPKGSKTKREAEAAEAASFNVSAPKGRTPGRPPTKKRKKVSDQTAAGPSDTAELHHNDSVNSPVRASSSQAPVTSPETSAPQDIDLQSRQGRPPRSSLHSLAASIATSVRLPPISKQPPAPHAQQPRQQLPQQSSQQLQQHLQQQPMQALTSASEAASAPKIETGYLQSAMATIHELLERSDSD